MSYNVKTETDRNIIAGNANPSEISRLDGEITSVKQSLTTLSGKLNDYVIARNVSVSDISIDANETKSIEILEPNYRMEGYTPIGVSAVYTPSNICNTSNALYGNAIYVGLYNQFSYSINGALTVKFLYVKS